MVLTHSHGIYWCCTVSRTGGFEAGADGDDDEGGGGRGQPGAGVGAGLMSEDQRAGLKKVCRVPCAA